MIKKIMQYLWLCLAVVVGYAASSNYAYADYSLTELRIAATIALEAGSSGQKYKTPMENVARVIQQRHVEGKGNASWIEILYGGASWFEHSRGFASKSADELMVYIKAKAGNNWQHALQLAQMANNHSLAPLKVNGTIANGFIKGYRGKYGAKLFTDDVGHDFFNTTLGDQHKVAFCVTDAKGRCIKENNKYKKIDMKGLSENSPRQSTDWNYSGIDNLIKKGSNGKYDVAADNSGYSYATGNGDSGSYSNGGSSAAAKHNYEPSEGHENAQMCSMANIQRSYGADNDFCWYCSVVITMTNAYLKAAGAALPSAIALGKLILQLGFLIWLAYYILQQVSSFNPVQPSKMLQDILVMGFKVALAALAVDAANSVIVDYFINPIGELGTDYGMALYDKLIQ